MTKVDPESYDMDSTVGLPNQPVLIERGAYLKVSQISISFGLLSGRQAWPAI